MYRWTTELGKPNAKGFEAIHNFMNAADVIRPAGKAFMGGADLRTGGVSLFHLLFDLCSTMASQRYERAESHGAMLLAHRQHPAVRQAVVFNQPCHLSHDGNSSYIRDLCKRHGKQVVHLEWTKVYECLDNATKRYGRGMTHHLIEQYLDEVRQCILEQDYRGILLKVQFNNQTGLSSDTLIPYLRKHASWHTPRRYEKLDGAGRKLLFYDPRKQVIVGEAEIREITKVRRRGFPWRNHFKPKTLRFFNSAGIGLATVEQVAGLESFGSARNGVWLLTGEQYRQLVPQQHGKGPGCPTWA